MTGSAPFPDLNTREHQKFADDGSVKVTTVGVASGGTSSNFSAAFPTAGTAVGFYDGTNMVAGRASSSTPAGTEMAVITRNIPSGTQAVSGTFWQATQPVSGTFWQATQPVSGTVAISGSVAVTGTFWQATQPVSGTITVSNAFALDASVTALQVTQGSTTSGQSGNLVMGAVTTSAPSYTTAKTNPLSLTTAGALRVDGSAVTQPVSGTFWQATQPVSGTVTANIGTTNGLALDASVNGILLAQTSTTSGQTGPLIQGAVTTAAPSYTTAKTSPLSLTTAGALRVDGSAVTQPVSGTFWQATQPVSGTVTANIGTTNGLALDSSVNGVLLAQTSTTSGQTGPLIQGAVTTASPSYTTAKTSPLSLTTAGALRVDGSAVTQPVSGTFWQATQPVSGTVTANVGTTNGLALDASVSGLLVAQASTTSGQSGPLVQTATTTNAPTYTTAKTNPLSTDTSGLLRISLKDTPANTNKFLVTPDSVALPANQSVNVSQINGVTPLMGNGTTGTGSQRVTIASDNTAFSVNATLSAETTKVIGTARILGNAGAIVDGVITAATAPANMIVGGGVYNSTEPSPTTGQSTALQLDSKGRARTVLMDAAGNTRGANIDSSNRLSVTVDNVSATNISTNVAQVGGQTVATAGVNGTLAVGGNVATNVAIGTNPINLGAQAVSSENTAVTATRMAQLVTDLVGKLIVLPYANPENFVKGATAAITDTTSTSLLAAPAAGLRNYITHLIVGNSHATVGTFVNIQDGSGGTTLYTVPAASVYGGASIVFPTPLRQPTTATAIYVACATTGANVIVSASGYKGA